MDIAHFQLHTIVDHVYVGNESGNAIAFVFCLNMTCCIPTENNCRSQPPCIFEFTFRDTSRFTRKHKPTNGNTTYLLGQWCIVRNRYIKNFQKYDIHLGPRLKFRTGE